MDISNFLTGPAGQTVIQSVSQQLGLNKTEASSAISAAMPTILAGLTRNAQTATGAQSLNSALESKHDGSLLDNIGSILQGGGIHSLQQDGSGILGHIFGNQLDNVTKNVSQKSGVGLDKISSLLPILAPIVMAYLGKQKQQNNVSAGGLGDLLGGMLSGGASKSKSSGGIMDLVTGILDKNNDGNVFDDIIGGFFKK
ncbi:MAG: DUF937 domain-containing protein [Dysgonamonadaceae bacterium]|jgi:hypothetical protein|nr:DUF937 domain-containing protein [Dysgonamonadaceae bacterium]